VQSDPVYAAMVENVDSNIGHVLDAIDAAGQRDNTIVIFSSDNGGLATAEGSPTCNAPLHEGKGWMYEGGTRAPLIVRWPSIVPAGAITKQVATSTDFYPTLLECAGLPLLPEQHCDGVSLLPALKGEADFDRGAIFWHYPHYSNQGGSPGCSIREGDWKLIEFFEDNRLELYNLEDDISEEYDVGDEYPEKRDEMHAKLVEWRKSVLAKIPEVNPEYGSG